MLSQFPQNTVWSASGPAQNPEKMHYNGQKYLKLIIFQKFEQSFIPTKITKQNKKYWARNYMRHSFQPMHF